MKNSYSKRIEFETKAVRNINGLNYSVDMHSVCECAREKERERVSDSRGVQMDKAGPSSQRGDELKSQILNLLTEYLFIL